MLLRCSSWCCTRTNETLDEVHGPIFLHAPNLQIYWWNQSINIYAECWLQLQWSLTLTLKIESLDKAQSKDEIFFFVCVGELIWSWYQESILVVARRKKDGWTRRQKQLFVRAASLSADSLLSSHVPLRLIISQLSTPPSPTPMEAKKERRREDKHTNQSKLSKSNY